ncbi:hypothetical protein EGW08_019932 [Elysia chlorotica]|uniref:Reverse transcriptase domain-containing protein n=1 Tax=Elysia chlorotica TaxID=188477 RepID=A0A3S1AUA8_ELYCH|nr:hypothetical protein EGW08_019932 [Elysia chlorotica]
MDKQANLKSVNSVKEVTSSKAGHVSLGRDRHVRQVAPDRHLATVRNKIKIGTWNVRTLYEKGKFDNVKSEMTRMNINIFGLAEAPTVAATMFRLKKPKQPSKFQYDALKKDIELKRKFNVAIENKFAVLDELTEVEQKWALMKESLKGCAEEFIPKKEGRKPSPKSGCIKSQSGQILMDIDDILKRWSQYVEELFDDMRGLRPLIWNNEGPPIMEEEVRNAIKKMKHNKATRPDEIPVELFDALDETCLVHFTKPHLRHRTVAIRLEKINIYNPPKKTWRNRVRKPPHNISLMSHATKILLCIVMTRVRSKICLEIAESQFGFVPNKGTRNAILTLLMLMESAVEVQHDVYLCFIDYSNAFDKVKHLELFKIQDQLNFDGKDLRILRNLYWEQVAEIRIDRKYTDFTEIKTRLCTVPLYIEVILRNITDMEGIKVGGRNITSLRYADGTVLIVSS